MRGGKVKIRDTRGKQKNRGKIALLTEISN